MKLALETLRLRRLARSDGPAIRTPLDDGRVAQTVSLIPYPYPEGAEYVFIENSANKAFAIVGQVNGTETFLGVGRVSPPIYQDRGDVEFGYWVAPVFWGQGVGTRIIGLLLERAKREGAKTVVASALKVNAASLRIFEKHGFEITGEGAHEVSARGEVLPTWHMRLSLGGENES